MPQLEVAHYPSQLFWLLICLGILGWLMKAFLVPRLCKAIELRTQKIEADQATLHRLQQELRNLQEHNQNLLNTTYHEASQALHNTAESLKQEKEKVTRAFDQELSRKTAKALEELKIQQLKLKEDVPEIVEELLRELSPKLLGIILSSKDQRAIQKALEKEIGEL